MRKTFAEITADFIEKPFLKGGKSSDGYDCIGFCYAFIEALGKAEKFLTEYKGMTLENHHELYNRDPEGALQLMFEAFDSMGVEIPISKKLPGDLVIIKNELGRHYPGIYAGNENIMASYTNAGVRTIPIDGKQITVVRVRRL
jgi:hypothetical protein